MIEIGVERGLVQRLNKIIYKEMSCTVMENRYMVERSHVVGRKE